MKRFFRVLAASCVCLVADVHAAPFAYVADSGFSRIAVIDLATYTRRASIPFPTYDLYYIAVTPDGRHAYVSNDSADGHLWIVDTLTMQRQGPVDVGYAPSRPVASPDGNYVYLPFPYGNSVMSIPTATNVPTTININSPCDVVFTPDSRHAYVSNSNVNISIVDTQTNAVTKTISTGDSGFSVCSSLAITPDGSQIYATRSDKNQVAIIDTATNKVVGSPIQLTAAPVGAAAAPDGNHMYFITDLPGSLVVVSRATNTVQLTVPLNDYPAQLAVKPDGTELYVVYPDDNEVWAIKTSDYSTNHLTGFCNPGSIAIGSIATMDQLFTNSFDGC